MGWVFLWGYVILIGVATFLMKYAMKDLSPYQINFLMAIGMLVTGVPALLIADKTLKIPTKGLALGGGLGLMMAVGSILYLLALNKLPAGLVAVIAISYVVIVIVLSAVVLHERFDALKVLGVLLTVIGVAILTLRSS
jgi:drug/metabolite transporter (DMT)-like permease